MAHLPDLSRRTAARLAERFRRDRRSGDVVVLSVHWGSNWGYRVPNEQRRFARWMVDAGVHVVHGHSSHHPRPLELYRGGLVLYGCGDLVNDYEGIDGFAGFRDDLRAIYEVRLTPTTQRVDAVRILPLQARRMRLERAGDADVAWLAGVLDRESRPWGTRVGTSGDGLLVVGPD